MQIAAPILRCMKINPQQIIYCKYYSGRCWFEGNTMTKVVQFFSKLLQMVFFIKGPTCDGTFVICNISIFSSHIILTIWFFVTICPRWTHIWSHSRTPFDTATCANSCDPGQPLETSVRVRRSRRVRGNVEKCVGSHEQPFEVAIRCCILCRANASYNPNDPLTRQCQCRSSSTCPSAERPNLRWL